MAQKMYDVSIIVEVRPGDVRIVYGNMSGETEEAAVTAFAELIYGMPKETLLEWLERIDKQD